MKRFITNQGIRAVDNFGEQVTSRIMSEVLKDHRDKIIMQTYAALENYVEWRFKQFPTVSQVRAIRAILEQLKDCNVYLEEMPEVLEEVRHSDVIELSDEPFEKQIDMRIAEILSNRDMPWEQYL